MNNLWGLNTPAQFWQCGVEFASDSWLHAARQAKSVLDLPQEWDDFDTLLALVLGEGQFGPDHWRLSTARRLYYRMKPLIPRQLVKALRQTLSTTDHHNSQLQWPVEPRFAQFQWELMRQLMIQQGVETLPFVNFWPQHKQFAFVLTHDVETAAGQDFVRTVADWVEERGFRSMFNFVPERYTLDFAVIDDLVARGFEVGVHGLRHDGYLFSSYRTFQQRAERINHYLQRLNATGFRSPSTLRHPEWMQELAIEYDLSFFDTDPYEPIAGGTMTLWPFMIGRFVELPYTLPQDFTLTTVLKHTTPQLWLEKVDFIAQYHGMALVNVHPDYVLDNTTRQVFITFLDAMRERSDYWHALPREVARWWKARTQPSANNGSGDDNQARSNLANIALTDTGIIINCP